MHSVELHCRSQNNSRGLTVYTHSIEVQPAFLLEPYRMVVYHGWRKRPRSVARLADAILALSAG